MLSKGWKGDSLASIQRLEGYMLQYDSITIRTAVHHRVGALHGLGGTSPLSCYRPLLVVKFT